MSDLISRNDLNKIINSYDNGTINIYELLEKIRDIPTAFDADKAVEQLKEYERYVYDAVSDEDNYVIDTEKAIEIMKGAVRDD